MISRSAQLGVVVTVAMISWAMALSLLPSLNSYFPIGFPPAFLFGLVALVSAIVTWARYDFKPPSPFLDKARASVVSEEPPANVDEAVRRYFSEKNCRGIAADPLPNLPPLPSNAPVEQPKRLPEKPEEFDHQVKHILEIHVLVDNPNSIKQPEISEAVVERAVMAYVNKKLSNPQVITIPENRQIAIQKPQEEEKPKEPSPDIDPDPAPEITRDPGDIPPSPGLASVGDLDSSKMKHESSLKKRNRARGVESTQ